MQVRYHFVLLLQFFPMPHFLSLLPFDFLIELCLFLVVSLDEFGAGFVLLMEFVDFALQPFPHFFEPFRVVEGILPFEEFGRLVFSSLLRFITFMRHVFYFPLQLLVLLLQLLDLLLLRSKGFFLALQVVHQGLVFILQRIN